MASSVRDPGDISRLSNQTTAPIQRDSMTASSKRKNHRRAKKSRRHRDRSKLKSGHHPIGGCRDPEKMKNKNNNWTGKHTTRSSCSSRKKHRNQVYLRPTNGPLLNAPRNSTQFIIDDHQAMSSDSNNEAPQSGSQADENVSQNEDGDAELNPYVAGNRQANNDEGDDDEDDTFWAEFCERDFQSVYESAHQEEVEQWDRKRLCAEINALERRHRELVRILSKLDPEVYLQKLQSDLLSLQRVNTLFKEERMQLDPVPDSSTAPSDEDVQDSNNSEHAVHDSEESASNAVLGQSNGGNNTLDDIGESRARSGMELNEERSQGPSEDQASSSSATIVSQSQAKIV